RGVGATEDGLRQRQQQAGFLPAAGRLAGPAGREVNDAADGHGDGDEQQQRQQVVRLVDGERVQRRGGGPVEAEGGRRGGGGGRARPDAADPRERHHGDRVDRQIVGRPRVGRGRDQQGGQQRQADDGKQDPQQRPAGADGVGRARHQATAAGRGPSARRP